MQKESQTSLKPQVLEMLRCPVTGSPLRQQGQELVAESGGRRYPIRGGIVILLPEAGETDAAEGEDVCDESPDVP